MRREVSGSASAARALPRMLLNSLFLIDVSSRPSAIPSRLTPKMSGISPGEAAQESRVMPKAETITKEESAMSATLQIRSNIGSPLCAREVSGARRGESKRKPGRQSRASSAANRKLLRQRVTIVQQWDCTP